MDVRVQCTDLSYRYPGGDPVLQGVSLEIHAGEMVAVMGPSGGGKTTLLSLLAGKLEVQEGERIVEAPPRRIAFLPQEDTLFPGLTLRENLELYTRLRISLPREELETLLERTLDSLGLSECANRKPSALSGGEKRRASIGKELVHGPLILFFDEPTSGLDSQSSMEVVQALRAMSRSRDLTVILTLHQPSSSLLSLFDRVLFLREGTMEYCGVPEFLPRMEEDTSDLESNRLPEYHLPDSPISPSWFSKFLTLLERGFRQHRGGVLTWSAAFETLCLLGMTFGIWGHGDAPRYSLLYYCLAYVFYQTSFGSLHSFQSERWLVQHELQTRTYSLLLYVLAKTLSETVIDSIIPLFFGIIVYWSTGLHPTASSFFLFLLVLSLILMMGNSLGMLISAWTSDLRQANLWCRLSTSWAVLLSGFFVPATELGPFRILRWTSPIKYGYEALLRGQEVETIPLETTILQDLLALLTFFLFFRVLTFLRLRFFYR